MRLDAPAWLLSCALLSACGGNETTATAPPPKVSLRVSALFPVGEAAWQALFKRLKSQKGEHIARDWTRDDLYKRDGE